MSFTTAALRGPSEISCQTLITGPVSASQAMQPCADAYTCPAGNEPDILTPWQYPFAGAEYAPLTQQWVRYFLRSAYSSQPDGLPGNDDFGTMSAWLCWAYLGLYPITGTDQYVLASPYFDNVTIALPASDAQLVQSGPGGQVLAVIAHKSSCTSCDYLQKAVLNGQQLSSVLITHSQLRSTPSSVIETWLGDTPCPSLNCTP